jgi:hypothetical protein
MERMILCAAGDSHGAIDRLYEDILELEQSLGRGVRFSWVLHVGDLGIWPNPRRLDRATRKREGAGDFARWLAERKPAPRKTLFVKGNHEDFMWLDEQLCPTTGAVEILPDLFYLPNGARVELTDRTGSTEAEAEEGEAGEVEEGEAGEAQEGKAGEAQEGKAGEAQEGKAGEAQEGKAGEVAGGFKRGADGEVVSVGGIGGCFAPTDYDRPSAELSGFRKRHYTRDEIDRLLEAAPTDILLLHEVPAGVVYESRRRGRGQVSDAKGLDEVVRAKRPVVCFSGHHHTRFDSVVGDVPCLGLAMVGRPGNLVAFDIDPARRSFEIVGESRSARGHARL